MTSPLQFSIRTKANVKPWYDSRKEKSDNKMIDHIPCNKNDEETLAGFSNEAYMS